MNLHDQHLREALHLAQQGKGLCAPNPAVGAVLVKDGAIIGRGFHQAPGTPHAEIHALQSAGKAYGATLYVTLEPCCHFGRTPPCTNAIIAANIKQVYFAYQDPNPAVQGQGQKALIAAGIPCEHIPLSEINAFYQSYQHWTRTQTPWISIKLALSIDGKIAHGDKRPAMITNETLRAFTHQQRQKADALLTTINTILYDDPLFNVRLPDKILAKKIYVLDSQLQFPLQARILAAAQSITIFHSNPPNPSRLAELQKAGIRCIEIPKVDEKLDLIKIIEFIGQEGIHDLWVEAGRTAFNAFITQQLAHEVYLYFALKALGPEAYDAFNFPINLTDFYKTTNCQVFDNDIVCHLT